MLVNWSKEICMSSERNRFEDQKGRKIRPWLFPPNQELEQFYCQPMGQEKTGSNPEAVMILIEEDTEFSR